MKKILLLALLYSLAMNCFSQHPNWVSYNNNKDINCIYNDGNILWIGTTGGLVQYNKVTQSTIYYTKDNTILPSPNIIDIEKDAAGNLWVIMYEGGIAKYDGTNWTIISTANSQLSDDYIFDMCFDKYGKLWIATWDGVDCFYNNVWTNYNNSFLNLNAIAADTLGNIYGATDGYGMVKFNGTTWSNFSMLNSNILSSNITDLKIDSQNNVWMSSIVCGNGNPGLCKYSAGTFTNCITNQNFTDMYIDNMDNLWLVGYPYNVVYKFDGLNLTNYATGNLQSDNIYKVILYDGTHIWYNTFRDGLRKMDTNSVVVPVNISSSNIHYNYFNQIAADTSGNIWINHWTGLDRFDGSTFTYFDSASSGWPVNNIGTFSIDASNNFWFSTSYDGIYKYDGTTWQHFDSATYNFPTGRLAQAPMFDNAGNAYFLFAFNYDSLHKKTGGGFYKFDGTALTKITMTSINDTNIYGVSRDPSDRFWVSSFLKIEIVDGAVHTVITPSNLPIISGSIPRIMTWDTFGNGYMVTNVNSGNYYKVSPSLQSTAYNITNCNTGPIGDWVTNIIASPNNNLWIKMETTCSHDSDFVAARYNGSFFQIFGIQNSGITSTYSNLLLTNSNKVYFNGQGGLTVFTDTTMFVPVENIDKKSDTSFELYPNPATSTISIQQHNPGTYYSISVKDLLGNTVIQKKSSDKKTILDLGKLSSGIYIVSVETKNQTMFKKLIKQ